MHILVFIIALLCILGLELGFYHFVYKMKQLESHHKLKCLEKLNEENFKKLEESEEDRLNNEIREIDDITKKLEKF